MSIKDNLDRIEERIGKACIRSGRKREEVTLMGVAKFQPVEAVEEAVNAGLRCFGESRVQEALLKYKGFKEKYPDTELHFIGPLQRNKAKQAAGLFDCVQSVDRESLVTELQKHAAAAGPLAASPLPVLLEFRTGEDTKSGFTSLDDLCRAVDLLFGCPSLSVRGLMTIAPAVGDATGDDTGEEDILRSAFRRMVELRRELERRYPGGAWSCLSMGMTNDFEIAIEEGSTMVRIGTAIFGKGVA
jgi:pyridoxal phosphate enzyme (YggS family)